MRYTLFAVAFLLCSCNKTVQSIKQDEIRTNTVQGNAYLLLGVETSQDLKSIEFSGADSFSLSHKDITAGSSYILVPIMAGNYNIDKIRLNSYARMELKEEYWQFEAKPNAINYAGNLELLQRGFYFAPRTELVLKNKASDALKYIHESFPQLNERMPIVYSGPGEDDFFNIVRGIKSNAN